MNKRAKEKQLLEEAYIQVLEEEWKKGTSKAPKGKSFKYPSGAPSNRDHKADGDPDGGSLRRTRSPDAPSQRNHSEMEEAESKGELTISGPIKIGDHEHEVGSNDPLGSGKISKIIEYSNGYMIFAYDEYGGLMSRMVDLKGQGVGEGYLVKQ